MPEYLHPGVYVVEVEGHARPIEGVPTSTEAFVGSLLAFARERIPTLPGWTDHNVSDPGITLVELLAWVADAALLVGLHRVGEREAVQLSRAVASSLALLQRAKAPASPIARTCFLEGQTIDSLGLGKAPERR